MGVPGFNNRLAFDAMSQAVVIVIDGLGFNQLTRAGEVAPTLAAAADSQAPIDAAFPTTTPAGLASITLGTPPGWHGFVGASFRLPDFECMLNPLQWQDDPPPVAVLPDANLFSQFVGLEVRSHGPAAFAASGMTRRLLNSAISVPYEQFEPGSIETAPGRLDYVYLPKLDKAGHVHGPNTDAWNACLSEIDRLVVKVLRRLPPGAAVIVTSDHGMVSVPDDRRIDIDAAAFSEGVVQVAGEPRMRHLYCDDAAVVVDRWRSLVGDRGQVLTRGEAIAAGLFGAVDEALEERIGDVLAIANDDWSFASTDVDARVSGLRGLHGGLTDEELLVPALVLRGVA